MIKLHLMKHPLKTVKKQLTCLKISPKEESRRFHWMNTVFQRRLFLSRNTPRTPTAIHSFTIPTAISKQFNNTQSCRPATTLKKTTNFPPSTNQCSMLVPEDLNPKQRETRKHCRQARIRFQHSQMMPLKIMETNILTFLTCHPHQLRSQLRKIN